MEYFQEIFQKSVSERYLIHERLGEGTFGEVRRGTDRVTGEKVAVKYIRLGGKKNGIPKAIFRELEAMKQLSQCSYIIQLRNVFGSESNVCAVLEFMDSDLQRIMSESAPSRIPRGHVKAFIRMMLLALRYCHENNIIHRDIKPSSKFQVSAPTQTVFQLSSISTFRLFSVKIKWCCKAGRLWIGKSV
jgi:cyclin-dependent kinase 7